MLQITDSPNSPEVSIYELAGGEATFFRLVHTFYEGVANDAILRPLYPEDLGKSEHYTALFLIQFCGGPATYSQTKGHPRLRMRHLPFKIGVAERDAWVSQMRRAVEIEIENPKVRDYLNNYFEKTATWMINTQPYDNELNARAVP